MNEMSEIQFARSGQSPLSFSGKKLAEASNVNKTGRSEMANPSEGGFPIPISGAPRPGHTVALYRTEAGKYVSTVGWSGNLTLGTDGWSDADVQDDARRALDFLRSHDPLDEPHSHRSLKALYQCLKGASRAQPNPVATDAAAAITEMLNGYTKLISQLEVALTSERVA
jgi:hypothetical protein